MDKVVSLEEYRKSKLSETEKEYNEFVDILKLFISIRNPREQKVHVIAKEDKNYLMLNEKLNIIKAKFIGADVDMEDALLSALVNIAPNKIIIHNRDRFWNVRILETIKDVFENRVEFTEDII